MKDNNIIKALEELADYGSDFSAKILEFVKCQQAEIARLAEAHNRFSTDMDLKDIEEFELIRKVRTDTICKLAKRLEKRLANNYEISPIAYQSVIHDVSIVANEMIGEFL